VLRLLVEGQWKMLADFAVIIGVALMLELGKINSFLMFFFPIIITKDIFRMNVALTSFAGRIASIVARR
jgi:nitrogen fixation protein FixH